MGKKARKTNKHSIDLLKAKSCGHLSVLILIDTSILFNCSQFFLLWPLWHNLSPDYPPIFLLLFSVAFLGYSSCSHSLNDGYFFLTLFSLYEYSHYTTYMTIKSLSCFPVICPNSKLIVNSLLDIFTRKSSQHSYPFQDCSCSHIVCCYNNFIIGLLTSNLLIVSSFLFKNTTSIANIVNLFKNF